MPNSDQSSSQQQIIQSVLDEAAQALRVTPVTSPADPAYTVALGKPAVDQGFIDYSATPVTSAAYVTLIAATSAAITELEIFDSSGQLMIIAIGAAAAEVDQVYDFPGGNGRIPLEIAAGSRVSIKAASTTASVGYIAVNTYGV